MVKHLIFLFLLLQPFLFSGEFTASVNRNQIHSDENFILNLTLKGASAQGSPSLDALKKAFFINSQQQSSNIIMMNGNFSSNTTWRISLTPQKEGELTIPSISIHTSEGLLSSDPIKVTVLKGDSSNQSDRNELALTTEISKAKPYKNEPFLYTVRLNSKIDLANVKIQKFNIEDAIVEPNGEPKVYQKIYDGVKGNVIEFSYFVTPLKAGSLKIPPIAIQGGIPIRRNYPTGSFFDDGFESFFMMPHVNQLQPFTLTTEEATLDIQPAISGMIPWLPAKSFKIEEIWDNSQTLQIGEPITRGFKIFSEGILSNQLPSLKDLQISDNSFKIYEDKPEIGDEIKDGKLRSFRKEHYTLIPQQSGPLTLPEISIAWWDVTKNEKAFARIPSRTIQILSRAENMNSSSIIHQNEQALAVPTSSQSSIQKDPILYAFIAALAMLFFSAIVWAIALQRKIVRLTEKPLDLKIADKREQSQKSLHSATKIKPPAKDKNEKLPDLNPT